jgi:hypothetical protein
LQPPPDGDLIGRSTRASATARRAERAADDRVPRADEVTKIGSVETRIEKQGGIPMLGTSINP